MMTAVGLALLSALSAWTMIENKPLGNSTGVPSGTGTWDRAAVQRSNP
jgi:hypothetical protein